MYRDFALGQIQRANHTRSYHTPRSGLRDMLGALVAVVPRTISHSLIAADVSAIIGLSAYSYGFHRGHQQSSDQHAAQALRASEAARDIERQRQAQLQKAQHEAKIRENKIRGDFVLSATGCASNLPVTRPICLQFPAIPSLSTSLLAETYSRSVRSDLKRWRERLMDMPMTQSNSRRRHISEHPSPSNNPY